MKGFLRELFFPAVIKLTLEIQWIAQYLADKAFMELKSINLLGNRTQTRDVPVEPQFQYTNIWITSKLN